MHPSGMDKITGLNMTIPGRPYFILIRTNLLFLLEKILLSFL